MKPRSPVGLALSLYAALCAFAPAVPGQTKTDPAEVAFQAAVKTEVVDGDLRAAIASYQKLAAGSIAGSQPRRSSGWDNVSRCWAKPKRGRPMAGSLETSPIKKNRPPSPNEAAALDARGRRSLGHAPVVGRARGRRRERFPHRMDDSSLSSDRRPQHRPPDLLSGETRMLAESFRPEREPGGRLLVSPDGKAGRVRPVRRRRLSEVHLVGIDGSRRARSSRRSGRKLRRARAWSSERRHIRAVCGPNRAKAGRGVHIRPDLRPGWILPVLESLGPRWPNREEFPGRPFIVYAAPRATAK